MRLCKVRYNTAGCVVGLDFVFTENNTDTDRGLEPEYVDFDTTQALEKELHNNGTLYKDADFTLHEERPIYHIVTETKTKVERTNG